jgi:uncharacterized alpha-E superfamily protein
LLCHGVCDSTMTHDEGWHFIQAGTYLERADKVLRTLDSTVALLERSDASDLPVSSLQWAAVLRKCRAYEAYQRLYISRVEPERVVEFLLVNPDFPHSVRFCLERVLDSLTVISGRLPGRCDSESMRTLGSLVSELTYLDSSAVEGQRLHDFLGESVARCSTIGQHLQRQYSLS